MKPTNLVFIMSDEHNPRLLGCAGHKIIKTPNLDRLAARGTYFPDAHCNSPICVPSRASFATGHYVHKVRFWDNGNPYDGSVRGWGHRLIDTGMLTESEVSWLEIYNARTAGALFPLVDDDTRRWLDVATRPLTFN